MKDSVFRFLMLLLFIIAGVGALLTAYEESQFNKNVAQVQKTMENTDQKLDSLGVK